jgi:hypothetical protein
MAPTLDQIARDTADKIHAAYWAACDAAKAALDPSELTDETWAAELLAEAYDIALRCEADPLGWEEGRARW